MKCKICGGNLIFENGKYICDSCGSEFSGIDAFERIDAYICCIETDDFERKTKDGLVSKEIYSLLESKQINAFLASVSLDGLAETEFEQMIHNAAQQAKTFVIVSSSKRNFEIIFDKFKDYFTSNKVVLPVFFDMLADDIPKNISTIQALDYNRVGSGIDLVNAVLNALDRGSEINYQELNQKNLNNKKKKTIISIIIILFLLAVASYVFFGTSLIIDRNEETTLSQEESQRLQYEKAISCYENKDYVSAIKIFSELAKDNYEDSSSRLNTVYQTYAGYFKDESQNVTLHFNVQNSSTATVEIVKSSDSGNQLRVVTSVPLEKEFFAAEFNDSDNNTGTVTIGLTNDGITLEVSFDEIVSDFDVQGYSANFSLDEKQDAPFETELNHETLMSFLTERITLGGMSRKGVNASFVSPLYKSTECSAYRIDNTDIYLAVYTFDISKLTEEDSFYPTDDNAVDDPIVFAISAPAGAIIPNHIGNPVDVFVENNCLFVPNSIIAQCYHVVDFSSWDYYNQEDLKESQSIEKNTMVSVICKDSVGERIFDELVEYYTGTSPEEW